MTQDQSVVFIVDDDFYIRESVQDLLRSVGHEVQAFESIQAFLHGPRLDLPGCLILDVRLPETSGLEFQIAHAASGIQPPIVFLTGHGDIRCPWPRSHSTAAAARRPPGSPSCGSASPL